VRYAGEIYVPVTEAYFGGDSQLLRFDATGAYVSDALLVNALGDPESFSIYNLTSTSAGDIFGCGAGQRIAGWQWQPQGGTSFTPAVTLRDYAGTIEDDTANWTMGAAAGTLTDPPYNQDRAADDRDALVFRLQLL
jgi:hypothetical protein